MKKVGQRSFCGKWQKLFMHFQRMILHSVAPRSDFSFFQSHWKSVLMVIRSLKNLFVNNNSVIDLSSKLSASKVHLVTVDPPNRPSFSVSPTHWMNVLSWRQCPCRPRTLKDTTPVCDEDKDIPMHECLPHHLPAHVVRMFVPRTTCRWSTIWIDFLSRNMVSNRLQTFRACRP